MSCSLRRIPSRTRSLGRDDLSPEKRRRKNIYIANFTGVIKILKEKKKTVGNAVIHNRIQKKLLTRACQSFSRAKVSCPDEVRVTRQPVRRKKKRIVANCHYNTEYWIVDLCHSRSASKVFAQHAGFIRAFSFRFSISYHIISRSPRIERRLRRGCVATPPSLWKGNRRLEFHDDEDSPCRNFHVFRTYSSLTLGLSFSLLTQRVKNTRYRCTILSATGETGVESSVVDSRWIEHVASRSPSTGEAIFRLQKRFPLLVHT